MAKNDNLQDFLTDVANAIRNKKGTSNLINPQNFSSEIESIESSSFNAELFYGFWQLKKDNNTYVLKVYDTGKLDYEIYTSSPTKYTDISYTIINDIIEFQFVSGGSIDDIEITVKTFKYENDTLIDTITNDIYSHILFSDGTLSVTENGSYGSTDSNGFNMVEVNVPLQADNSALVGLIQRDITTLEIPEGTASIGENAFCRYSALTSITIPNSVTSIGGGAFDGCSGLTSINIPNSLTSIGDWAFNGCSGLTSVTIGSGVISIGSYAFSDCSGLTSVTIGSGVTSIGSDAFYSCSNLTNVTIPDSVTSIENGAFTSCTSLTNVIIPNSVTSIEREVFYNCTSLTSITIPDSVTSIGGSAFRNCSSLTSITIPNSVTSIGGSAFRNCSSLTSITIPNSVTSIGGYTFNGCNKLTEMTILATTPPTLSNTNAISTATTTIYIPSGTLEAYQTATNWSSFADKFVELSA